MKRSRGWRHPLHIHPILKADTRDTSAALDRARKRYRHFRETNGLGHVVFVSSTEALDRGNDRCGFRSLAFQIVESEIRKDYGDATGLTSGKTILRITHIEDLTGGPGHLERAMMAALGKDADPVPEGPWHCALYRDFVASLDRIVSGDLHETRGAVELVPSDPVDWSDIAAFLAVKGISAQGFRGDAENAFRLRIPESPGLIRGSGKDLLLETAWKRLCKRIPDMERSHKP